MKVCPQCSQHNRVAASVCQHCGYRFASRQSAPRTRQPTRSQAGSVRRWARRGQPWTTVGALVFVLLVGLFGVNRYTNRERIDTASGSFTTAVAVDPALATAVPASVTPGALQRALAATVRVIVPDDGATGSASVGSGSVVSEQGHILTNFHVVGDASTRQIYNRAGRILIAVSAPGEPVGAPEIRYQAELIEADHQFDLALLKIRAMEDGSPLPATLALTPLPIGDSDNVQLGDELTIIGYPGLGGDTVTLTRGIVAGYLPDEGWLKTDAEINPGNSGGTAINSAGQLVGVPSAESRATTDPGKIGLVRPINLAQTLLHLAQ